MQVPAPCALALSDPIIFVCLDHLYTDFLGTVCQQFSCLFILAKCIFQTSCHGIQCCPRLLAVSVLFWSIAVHVCSCQFCCLLSCAHLSQIYPNSLTSSSSVSPAAHRLLDWMCLCRRFFCLFCCQFCISSTSVYLSVHMHKSSWVLELFYSCSTCVSLLFCICLVRRICSANRAKAGSTHSYPQRHPSI